MRRVWKGTVTGLDVLIVDSNPFLRRVMRSYLMRVRYLVGVVGDGRAAWDLLQRVPVPLLVTTWPVPGVDGEGLLHHLRGAEVYTYVILLSDRSNQEALLTGMQAGADDYLVKPLRLKELRRRVMLGRRIQKLENQLRQASRERDALLTHDPLTGALNRQGIYERAAAALADHQRSGRSFSLVLLELDHLAAINSRYGYQIGDEVLRLVAETAARTIRQGDAVGRWSSGQFLLLLSDTSVQTAGLIAERVRSRIKGLVFRGPDGRQCGLSGSLGIACTAQVRGPNVPLLISCAEEALVRARQAGHNHVAVYEPVHETS